MKEEQGPAVVGKTLIRDKVYSGGFNVIEATSFEDGSLMLMHIDKFGATDDSSMLILHPDEVKALKEFL